MHTSLPGPGPLAVVSATATVATLMRAARCGRAEAWWLSVTGEVRWSDRRAWVSGAQAFIPRAQRTPGGCTCSLEPLALGMFVTLVCAKYARRSRTQAP